MVLLLCLSSWLAAYHVFKFVWGTTGNILINCSFSYTANIVHLPFPVFCSGLCMHAGGLHGDGSFVAYGGVKLTYMGQE